MKFITASKLLVLPFLASINAVQAVEKDAASKVVNSSSIQKKGSFLKHRELHQQKLNEFKKKARNLEFSEETEQLLSCLQKGYYPEHESLTISVKKKDYDQVTLNYVGCQENYKAVKQEVVDCSEVPFIVTGELCIPDIDACPNDYAALLMAIADALKSEGEDEGYEQFSMEADLYSKDKCAYPQCFAKPNKEFTFTSSANPNPEDEEDDPPSPYSCPEIGGTCEVDCDDDDAFICLPGLCYNNKDYDADYNPQEFDVPEEKNAAPEAGNLRTFKTGFGNKRQLKAGKGTKAPKGSKAPKVGKAGKCTCKVPRAGQYS